MKINIGNDEYTFPELNALFKVQYGIDLIFINFYYWRELICLPPNKRKAIPYRFELRDTRNYFWGGISCLYNDKYFLEIHTAIFKRRILQERYSIKVTIFDLISRNCFKRHPEIRYRFGTLMIEGFQIFIYNFSRWYLLIQMGDGTDGYPGYKWKMRYNKNIFENSLSASYHPSEMVRVYDLKRCTRE